MKGLVLSRALSISISGGFASSLKEKYEASVLDEFRTIPKIIDDISYS